MKKSLAAVSAFTVVLLYGILGGVVALICFLSDFPASTAILVVAAVLVIQYLLSPWLTDLNMRLFYKADFNAEIPDWLRSFIEQVCEEKNMKYPRVAVIYDGAPNAFTYGHTKNDARIILTDGIFDLLDEEEVKAVTAHELGHAVHYDMLLMTAVQLVPMVLYAIYDACINSTKRSKSSKSDKGKGSAVLIGLIAIIFYFICEYIILWFSRTREYYADEFSARETGNPNALSSALVQIGFGLSTHRRDAKEKGRSKGGSRHSAASPSTLGISDAKTSAGLAVSCFEDGGISKEYVKDAMKWDLWNVWAKLYELSSTHPLVSKRIIALGKLSEEYGQRPYVDFNLEKDESYADDFLKELLVAFLPWLFLITGLIFGFILVSRAETVNQGMIIMAAGFVLMAGASVYKHRYRHPDGFSERTVRSLLKEVKVSGITSIPCDLEGLVIGRGNPGCVFNEDFVLQDETGIIFLDYNQPLRVQNKIFALFRSPESFNKTAYIRGWYRRSPVPYIELLTIEVDGKVKKLSTVKVGYILRYILLAITVLFFAFTIFGGLAYSGL